MVLEEVMTSAEYHSTPGLSASGMKDLLVSPLRYWYLWINPERPEVEDTAAQRVGQALHCAVLETAAYDSRYACELNPPEECLDTIEQLREFIRQCGKKPIGTRKADVIAQVQALSEKVPILEVLKREHAEANSGKVILSIEEWNRVAGMCEALVSEPRVNMALSKGVPEYPIFARDPESGVQLKCRLDWIAGPLIFDIKTFTQQRGKSIDRCVADAIYYEAYYRQAWFYAWIRELWRETKGMEREKQQFVFAFVESDPPHETRIKCLDLTGSLYAAQAEREVRQCIDLYADHMKRFGEKPWRSAQEVTPLEDSEMKGLFF
jgi:hypothetical protein